VWSKTRGEFTRHRTPTRFLLLLSGSLTIRVDAVAVELGSGQVDVD
jgi:uncharacterized cupin superfamily protein